MTLPAAACTAYQVIVRRLFDARPLLPPLTVPALALVRDRWRNVEAEPDRPPIARHVLAAEALMRMEARARTVAWDLTPEHRKPRVEAKR